MEVRNCWYHWVNVVHRTEDVPGFERSHRSLLRTIDFVRWGSIATGPLPFGRTRSPLWPENRPFSDARSCGTCLSPQ